MDKRYIPANRDGCSIVTQHAEYREETELGGLARVVTATHAKIRSLDVQEQEIR
jgi:hypothetical protein